MIDTGKIYWQTATIDLDESGFVPVDVWWDGEKWTKDIGKAVAVGRDREPPAIKEST